MDNILPTDRHTETDDAIVTPTSPSTNSLPTNSNNDLNTYIPTKSNTYTPIKSNQEDSTPKAIQNRFMNYLGITPTSATASSNNYYVMRDHE